MLDLLSLTVEWLDAGRSFVTAVVLDSKGSTPQGAGVRALIDATGRLCGTIGGGAAEAEAQRRAIDACRTGSPVRFDIDMTHAYSREAAAICGGRMRVLLNPATAVDRDAYVRAMEARIRRERGVLVTRVWEDGKTRVTVEWASETSLPAGAPYPGAEGIRSCLDREGAQVFLPDPQRPNSDSAVLVEPIIPSPLLLIAGGGHVGQALAQIAPTLGFAVTVIDDRPEFAAPERFPEEVSTRCGDIAIEVGAFPCGSDVFIVLVTRGHKSDAEALEACIHKPAAYIGMMGSARKVALIRRDFIASGLATEQDFSRVSAPIGLDIGAVTVPEIAASIAAELIAVRRNGSTPRLRQAMEAP